MNNTQALDEHIKKLEEAKEKIRTRILAEDSPGVNGVAIHPELEKGKLLIFYTDEELARPFVLGVLGDSFLELIEWTSGEPEPDTPESPPRLGFFSSILRNLKILLRIVPLVKATSGIWADKPGRVACFLSLNDQHDPIGVLTAEHIFRKKEETPTSDPHDVYVWYDQNYYKAGRKWRFASLSGGRGKADCAIFRPDTGIIDIEPTSEMTIDWIRANQLASTKNHNARNFTDSPKIGIVRDVDVPIRCIHNFPVKTTSTLNHQILVEGQDFGFGGHSGTLIVMNETIQGSFKKGDPLGLYVYRCKGGRYHFLTPIHACFDTFQEATGIYSPPP